VSATVWGAALLAALAVAAALPTSKEPPARITHPGGRRRPARSVGRGAPRWRGGAAVLVALGTTAVVGGASGLALGVVLGIVMWRFIGRMEAPAERRRRERLARDLPDVVDLMAACLMAGLSPSAAVERVSAAVDRPMAEELWSVTARLRLGVDPIRVWTELGAHPQLGPLGRCVARAAESGASVADAMRRLADDQRRSSRAEVEGAARAVGVKAAVPLGLCLLPAFVLVGVVPVVAGSLGGFLR
jgi:Flp pilus assembly protein TadB